MFLGGGIDPIWTTNPLVRSQVDSGVDVPYGPEQIVESGAVRLGPHWAPLGKYSRKLAILNGVFLQTANHNTGHMQLTRLKTSVHAQMPSLLDILGSRRDGQPLASITVGAFFQEDYSSGWFATPVKSGGADPSEKDLFGHLDELAPADLERMARVLRVQAAHLRGTAGPPEKLVTAGNIEQAAALFDYLPKTKPFVLEVWSQDRLGQSFAESLQRVLWALENDVTGGALVVLGGSGWDSHFENEKRQARFSGQFAPQLARFLDRLDTLRNAHGTLAENTLMVVGSEIGRFPRLNDLAGKDHFPEAPYLLIGPGINTNQGQGAMFGGTGRQGEALPISLRTGKEAASGGHRVTLDDLGTTLLRSAGFEPSAYGYSGQNLDFLYQS